jgi:hypothetical protein
MWLAVVAVVVMVAMVVVVGLGGLMKTASFVFMVDGIILFHDNGNINMETWNIYKILVEKSFGRRLLGRLRRI